MNELYACIDIQTYTTINSIQSLQKEATRTTQEPKNNIHYELTKNNKILLGDMDYVKSYKEALQSDYYTKPDRYGRYHKEPEVKAIGIVQQYSHAAHLERDPVIFNKWINDNINYLKKAFPGCKIHSILHLDETTPHIQSIVIPIDPKGKISKNHFIPNKKAMIRIRDEYSNDMLKYGLQRGIPASQKKSQAKELGDIKNQIEAKLEYLSLLCKNIEKAQQTLKELREDLYKLNEKEISITPHFDYDDRYER